MKPLPHTFRSEGWTFTAVARRGNLALYRKQCGKVESWEVVRVQTRPDTTFPDGRFSPAHECFPRSRDWGVLGWTFTCESDGWRKLEALTSTDASSAYPQAPVNEQSPT